MNISKCNIFFCSLSARGKKIRSTRLSWHVWLQEKSLVTFQRVYLLQLQIDSLHACLPPGNKRYLQVKNPWWSTTKTIQSHKLKKGNPFLTSLRNHLNFEIFVFKWRCSVNTNKALAILIIIYVYLAVPENSQEH